MPHLRVPPFVASLTVGLLFAPAAFAQRQGPAPPPVGPAQDEAAPVDPDVGPKTGPPLPRGFQPPPAKPESFTTVTPLATPAELEELRRSIERERYRDVLEVGPTDPKRKEIIENWAKYRVAQLTGLAPPPEVEEDEEAEEGAVVAEPEPPGPLVEDRMALKEAVDELIREANRNVGPRGGGRQVEDVKLAVFPILVAELVKLKDNHLVLRSQAVKILSRLEVAGDGRAGNPIKRYGPALGPLLEIFRATGDEEPELAVKYQTAHAVAFIAENGRNVPGKLEFEAANLFADALAGHPEYPGWMQAGLAGAVARLNLREPALALKLMTAVTDESRPFEARTKAAAAVVRLPGVPAEVKQALPGALEELGRAMAQGYNARPSTEYVENFRTLEFVFKPVAPSEVGRLRDAILTDTSVPSFLQAAYGRLHPLVKHVAGQDLTASPGSWKPIPADLLATAGVDAG